MRPQIATGNHSKIVVIGIETGDFEVAKSLILAVNRFYERKSNTQPLVIQIGHKDLATAP